MWSVLGAGASWGGVSWKGAASRGASWNGEASSEASWNGDASSGVSWAGAGANEAPERGADDPWEVSASLAARLVPRGGGAGGAHSSEMLGRLGESSAWAGASGAGGAIAAGTAAGAGSALAGEGAANGSMSSSAGAELNWLWIGWSAFNLARRSAALVVASEAGASAGIGVEGRDDQSSSNGLTEVSTGVSC